LNINFRKILYILFISAIIGFAYNFISPTGIPLIKKEIKLGALAKQPSNTGELDYTKIKAVNLEQAYTLYNEGAKFVDSRDMWEYADGHIKGSVSFPEIEFEINHPALSKLEKDDNLVIYCSSSECGLSTKLAIELLKLGFENLFVFEEGWDAWLENGYPIETGYLP
jgi:rhodanese-related sulfurtransferase